MLLPGAACYLPFIVTLATVLQRVDLAPPSGREHRPFATLRAGYSYIWSHKTLRALLSIDLIPVMLGMTHFGCCRCWRARCCIAVAAVWGRCRRARGRGADRRADRRGAVGDRRAGADRALGG
ncbi:MAG: hypothetical protein U0841_13015 [Chloroflexia bacterium]